MNGLPNRVRSQMPRGPDGRTVLTDPDDEHSPEPVVGAAASAAFHTGYKRDRSAEPAAPQGDQNEGQLPVRGRRRKLLSLAIQNATPQWTRTRAWTKALLAFKIQFGDRLPDAN